MKPQATFRRFSPGQLLLLPPDMAKWLPEGHLTYFIRDVVGQLDLSAIYASYDGSKGGYPPYHPEMMVALLIYAYCVGMPSSRKIEKATHELIPFRVLSADQHPDHATIAEFRRRHLTALAALFVQVLRLRQKAGLVKLGHVSLDGTKVRANASKHKAMSYARMEKSVGELEAEVTPLLAQAEATDEDEDERGGGENEPSAEVHRIPDQSIRSLHDQTPRRLAGWQRTSRHPPIMTSSSRFMWTGSEFAPNSGTISSFSETELAESACGRYRATDDRGRTAGAA